MNAVKMTGMERCLHGSAGVTGGYIPGWQRSWIARLHALCAPLGFPCLPAIEPAYPSDLPPDQTHERHIGGHQRSGPKGSQAQQPSCADAECAASIGHWLCFLRTHSVPQVGKSCTSLRRCTSPSRLHTSSRLACSSASCSPVSAVLSGRPSVLALLESPGISVAADSCMTSVLVSLHVLCKSQLACQKGLIQLAAV